MKDNQIQYIELYATDLGKIKEFYSSVFDWTFVDYGDNYTAFEGKSSGVDGGFEKIKTANTPSSNSRLRPGASAYASSFAKASEGKKASVDRSDGQARELEDGKKGVLVILYHSNLEQAKENVIKGGGEIVKDIFSFPGGRRFQFLDPAGNDLAVWSDK